MEDDSKGTQSAVSPSSLPCEMEVLPHLEEEQENISESASLDEQTQPDTSSEQTASPAEKKPLCGDKSSNHAGSLSSTVGNGSLDEIVDPTGTVCDKSLGDFGFTKGKLSRCDSLEDVKCCDVKLNGDIPNVNKGLEYVELAIKDWSPPPKNQIYQQSSLQPSPKASKYLTESSVKSSESPVNHCLSNGPSHSNHPLAKPYNPENFQKHPPGMSPYTPPSCATTPTTPVLVKTRKGTQMTFDDMLKQLEEKIKLLIHTEDFSVRGTCRSALKFIQQQTRYSPDVVLTEHVVDKIVQHGMAHVFLRVWRSVLAIAPQENLLQLPIESFAYKNLDVTLSIIWNCSDKSVPLCNCLSRCGVIGLLMVELSKSEHTVLSIPENTLKVSDTQTSLLYLVKAYLGILHNIVRLCVDSCTLFRAADAVVILRGYLAAKQGLVYAKAYLILAYLIDEQENELVNASDEHVQFMVDVLKDATCSENHFSETHGFNAAEIACGLNHLAVNDSNKTKIVKAGALQYYARLLQGDSLQEQVLAAAGLWILAFDDDNKRKIHDQSGCITDLTYLADTSPQEEIRRSARGALWVLNSVPIGRPAGITRQMSVTGDNADIPHVMLSYNHSTQPMMIKICAKLRERGYKVWMDVDHMFGSTLEAMALAVEQSAVVLVAMCQRYKDSASCRTEAEYTYQLRKDIIPLLLERDYKADGWLGVLIGTRLYNDFSTEEAMNNSIDRLVRELGKRGRLRETVSRQSTRERTISGQLSVGALSSSSASSSSRRSHANSESEPGLPSISSISTSASSSLHGSIVRVTPPTPVTPSTPLTPPSIAPPLSEVVRWSNEHVASWLFANKLAPVMDKFSEFDGDLLLEYRQMFITSPDFFYQSLERHLGLSIIYILRFTKALKGIG